MDYFMESSRNRNAIVRAGDIRLDPRSLILAVGDREHRLTPTEASLLAVLMRHRDRILQRDEIVRSVWPNGGPRSRSLLPVYIRGLRRILEPLPHVPRRLISVVGRGYMLRTTPGDDSVVCPPTWRRTAMAFASPSQAS
jgi:two-component system KDP operon response regulator KdpE